MISRIRRKVISSPIDVVSWDEALTRVSAWSHAHESRVVCFCNVHSVITAREDHEFAQTVANCDLASPDGAPVAWMLRRLGYKGQQRINGPDFMWKYCALAEEEGQRVFFYGNTQDTLVQLKARLENSFPELKIAGMISPPFRPLTDEEDSAMVEKINSSGAEIVFVSLGCPKQEKWMAAHKDMIYAVMLGVGAAFDFHAGTVQRAPSWMRRFALEWVHRLCSEPKRLWKRYLSTNTLFVLEAFLQLLGGSNK